MKEQGCNDFHMIHDSYGVPVKYVAALNKAVREAYKELFETKPLLKWFEQVLPDYERKPQDVMINTLDLNDVLTSSYIFS